MIVRGIVIAALGTTGACLLPSEPVSVLDLSLSLSRSRMRPDSTILVRVAATNRTPHPVRLETTGGCVVSFIVLAPDSADVGPRFGCPSILVEVRLAPGEAREMAFALSPAPRLAQGGVPLRWPAGTYRVVGLLHDREAGIVRRTQPAEFELVCRDPSWTEC